MITFELDEETHNSDGTLLDRPLYWLGGTFVTGADEEHANEIYEQFVAHETYLDE